MASALKAVIFDMDGLMIESEGRQSLSLEKMLREHGTEPILTPAGIVQIVGMRAEDNIKLLKNRHNLAASVDDLHRRKNEIYQEVLAEGVEVMPGLPELLADLRNAPVKKALASSSQKADIDLVLRHLGFEDYFDAVVSGYEVAAGKPAPDIFLEAAKRMEAKPAECLVLEDAAVGVEAARAAGMKVIAVPSRYTRNHDFGDADLVASSLKELSWAKISNV